MKKNLILLASVMLVTAGCESWNSDESENNAVMKEPAGAQSQSSDVNQASSSRNVGQPGANPIPSGTGISTNSSSEQNNQNQNSSTPE